MVVLRRLFVACALTCLVGGLGAAPSLAGGQGVFFSTKTLLHDFFQQSTKVRFEKLADPTDATVQQVVYLGETDGVVDGYAVVLNETGQHEPITFGVLISTAGVVQRVEVMAYREAYGHEIRSPRYLRQYVGKTAKDLAGRDDVDAISGATISCRSARKAVIHALAIVDALRLKD